MSAEQFSRPGAIDLSALRPAAGAAPGAGAGAAAPGTAGSYSFDATEQSFQTDVVEASLSHPVVLALWASRAPTSREAVDLLSRVADSYGGKLALARLDIDASAQLAQALQVRAVPYVLAVLRGQPVPLFEGSVDEEQARQAFDQVVQAAVTSGVTGRAPATGAPATGAPPEPAAAVDEVEEEQSDPRYAEGDAALEVGDFAGAVTAYERVVEASPGDEEAGARLAQAQLFQRTDGVDAAAARAAAAAAPLDLDAQLLAADVELLGGDIDAAFDRVIALVPRIFGDDRERARRHLLGLFATVGPEDPRVAVARRRLANALF
jgi:putative thioredoxin